MPLFSVIIPAYNAENFLSKAINSVCMQDCSDWEIILIDDGSSDNTLRVCKEFEKNHYNITAFREKMKVFQLQEI